jgi:hypothetical protein
MPYIKRASDGSILAVSNEPLDAPCEQLGADAPELRAFLAGVAEQGGVFETSDLKLIRAIEDVIDLLIKKNVICITDLPLAVQNKLMERRSLRHSLNALKLFGDDEQGTI